MRYDECKIELENMRLDIGTVNSGGKTLAERCVICPYIKSVLVWHHGMDGTTDDSSLIMIELETIDNLIEYLVKQAPFTDVNGLDKWQD